MRPRESEKRERSERPERDFEVDEASGLIIDIVGRMLYLRPV